MEILAAIVVIGSMLVVKRAFRLAWRYMKKQTKLEYGKEDKKGKS